MSDPLGPPVEPAESASGGPTGRVTALAAAWGGALALLAIEWTRTPVSGPGHAFLIWSLPAVPLAAFTWTWLRRLPVQRIPLGFSTLAPIIVIWAVVGVVTVNGTGTEWTLDGVILRRPLQRAGGIALWWAPGVWGLTLSVAGLAAALEARYQLARGSGAGTRVGEPTPHSTPDGVRGKSDPT